jgi:hypothetical protein
MVGAQAVRGAVPLLAMPILRRPCPHHPPPSRPLHSPTGPTTHSPNSPRHGSVQHCHAQEEASIPGTQYTEKATVPPPRKRGRKRRRHAHADAAGTNKPKIYTPQKLQESAILEPRTRIYGKRRQPNGTRITKRCGYAW